MKNLSKLLMAGFIAIGLSACGTATNPNGQQIIGYNQNGTPIYGNNNGMIAGNGCITSMNQPLSLNFTAQGLDAVQARFFAGTIPQFGTAAGAHGTVSLAGGMQQTPGSITMSKQSQNGSINMTLNTQARTASGSIQISSQALYQSGVMNSMYSYNTGNNSQICVTSIALDVVYVGQAYNTQYGQTSTGSISQALVYLYLNNGQVVQAPVAL